jgi:putative copper export protein
VTGTRCFLVILVRLLLFLALACIGVSALLYLYSRDRKYLKFIGKVLRFTIVLGIVVFVYFAFERIVGPLL